MKFHLSNKLAESCLDPALSIVSEATESYDFDKISSVLQPKICKIDNLNYSSEYQLNEAILRTSPNVQTSARNYPLTLTEGLYFSDVLGVRNKEREGYWNFIRSSLQLLTDSLTSKETIPFNELLQIGSQMQLIDSDFAATKIDQPQDPIHLHYGPSEKHPYAKTTLCRTTFPVKIGDRIVPFFFEKFLIAYSYLDKDKRRRSTITPIHSHPFNFETAYFTSYGPDSYIFEQEFQLFREDGTPFFDLRKKEGFNSLPRAEDFTSLIPKPLESHIVRASNQPIILPTFEIDRLMADEKIIELTDGFFRVHQVTVHDDSNANCETLYYTILNYFGPNNRVVIYSNLKDNSLWDSSTWT